MDGRKEGKRKRETDRDRMRARGREEGRKRKRKTHNAIHMSTREKKYLGINLTKHSPARYEEDVKL